MLQELRTGRTPAAASPWMDRFPFAEDDDNIRSKHRSAKSGNDADDGYKVIRAICYFCDGPLKSDDCPHWAVYAAPPAASTPLHSGFPGGVLDGLGTGLFVSVGTGSADHQRHQTAFGEQARMSSW